MRTTHDQVKEFHETFEHPVSNNKASIKDMDPKRVQLRMDLIAEEFFELVGAVYNEEAAKKIASHWSDLHDDHVIDLYDPESNNYDVVETADALADLDYVINGFALEAGIPHDDVVAEVHNSNMSKLGEDGRPIYREDGKILKGPDYFRPDIPKVFANHNK